MSKISPKQRYVQLIEWLELRKQKSSRKPGTSRTPQRFSKADVYNKSTR